MRFPKVEPLPESLNLISASRFLDMRPESLRQHARFGNIPSFKIGRLLYFRRADLVAFVNRLAAGEKVSLRRRAS